MNENFKKEYKEFLMESKNCNFQQSIEWGNVKIDWEKEVLVVRDKDGKITSAVMILIRKIPIFGNVIYISRGPIYTKLSFEEMEKLISLLKQKAKELKALAVLMEPDVSVKDLQFRDIMIKLGFKISQSKNFSDQINPRFVFRLDIKGKTKEEVMASFKPKTRYNIRCAERKGVEIYEGTKEDLKIFSKIMEETGKRNSFGIRPLSYFERMYEELGEKHIKLYMAKHEGDVIAGILNIYYGNKVWYLYGASSNKKRNFMPNYLLQWTAIKDAIDKKMDIYDFRGVPGVSEDEKNHPQYGLYRFKKGFNADLTEFIGQVYLTVRPVRYFLMMKLQKLNRKIVFYKKRILGNN